jgi:DNA-binding transcriptional regulator YiaG
MITEHTISRENDGLSGPQRVKMNTETIKRGRRPVGYLTNAEGKRTHAIVPLDEAMDEWEALPSEKADAVDLTFLARVEKDPEDFLKPASITNPIRSARLNATITQEALARAMGISAAALSKQEQEDHTPRPRTIDRALKKLAELAG